MYADTNTGNALPVSLLVYIARLPEADIAGVGWSCSANGWIKYVTELSLSLSLS